VMDKDFIGQLLAEAGCTFSIDDITLARELWEKIPAEKLAGFSKVVITHCYDYCAPLLPEGKLTILLIDDDGYVFSS